MTVHDALARYFATVDWPIRADEGGRSFSFPATGEYGSWLMQAVAHEELPGAIVYAEHPEPVPMDQRSEGAVLVARLNDGLPIGNFELDQDTGVVRAKASLEAAGDELSDEAINRLVRAAVALMNRHFPAISALVSGAQASEAISVLEA